MAFTDIVKNTSNFSDIAKTENPIRSAKFLEIGSGFKLLIGTNRQLVITPYAETSLWSDIIKSN